MVFILCKNEMLICCYKLDHLKFALFIKSTWNQFDKLCDQKYCVYIQIIENEREKKTKQPMNPLKQQNVGNIWPIIQKCSSTKSNFHINSSEMAVTLIDLIKLCAF